MSFYGNIILEKVSIIPPTTKNGNYSTNKKFKGVTIQTSVGSNQDSEEEINKIANNLEKDIKILNKNYDKAMKPEFEKLFSESKESGLECNSVAELIKIMKLYSITYHYFSNNKVALFELAFSFHDKNNFFGLHEFFIELYIKNNDIVPKYGRLEG